VIDPFAAPVASKAEPVIDPFAAPVAPKAEPVIDPFVAPAAPKAEPVIDPFAASVIDPFATPVAPQTAPVADPFAVPVVDPFAAPVNYFPDNGPTPPPAPFESAPKTKSKKKDKAKNKPKKEKRVRALPIVLSIIAVILVAAIVGGLLTNWFGFYGPTARIMSAAKKTMRAENFTMDITLNDETISLEVAVDLEKEDLTVVIIDEEESIVGAIYDGYSINYSDLHQMYFYTDVSEKIETFFKLYKSAEEMDIEKLIEVIVGEDNVEDLYDDTINLKELKSALRTLYFKSNSNGWLKDNAGYSKEHADGVTTFSFEPDLTDLSLALLEELEEAFIDEDDYDSLKDSLKDASDYFEVELSVGLKRGKLHRIEFSVFSDSIPLFGSIDAVVEIEFSRIGTTGIDTETLDGILAEAQSDVQ